MELFLKLQPQIKSAYEEISILSKKKPTEAVNNFKLKFINSMVAKANEILGNKYQPFSKDEFAQFNEDDIPTNSDIVFILSNYLTSFEKLRCDNIIEYYSTWYWVIDGEKSGKKTDRPTIL